MTKNQKLILLVLISMMGCGLGSITPAQAATTITSVNDLQDKQTVHFGASFNDYDVYAPKTELGTDVTLDLQSFSPTRPASTNLFGVYTKDAGHIYLEGQEVNFKNSKEALEHGVAMVHQELNQALKRNVMDNMWLGRFPMTGPFTSEKKMYDATMEVFNDLGISVNPKTIMSTMPVSQRQMVEIAKAVSFNSKVIVFDEPTSSLTETEVEHLFKIINMLRDRGCGIIYISHKMAEIKRISDDITVMRDGKWVATKPADELEMGDIIKLMVGRELTNQFPPKTNHPGETYLKVEHLTGMYNQLKDVSFEARRGEVLGLAGLDSSGRTEVLESIFGIRTRKEGTITLDGKPCKNRNSGESIKNGFAMLTEERRCNRRYQLQPR